MLTKLNNNQLTIYNNYNLKIKNTNPTYFNLYYNKILKNTSYKNYINHPITYITINKKKLFYKYNNKIIILKIKKNKKTKINKKNNNKIIINIKHQ